MIGNIETGLRHVLRLRRRYQWYWILGTARHASDGVLNEMWIRSISEVDSS